MPIYILTDLGVCEVSIRITSYNFFSVSSAPDAEWKKIIYVLWVKYGIRSTGSKILDKQKLRELELKEIREKNGEVSGEFVTVSKIEIEKIKEKIKEKKIQKNPKEYAEQHGAQILGEQIMIAIKMKKEEDEKENKKKRENKYQI